MLICVCICGRSGKSAFRRILSELNRDKKEKLIYAEGSMMSHFDFSDEIEKYLFLTFFRKNMVIRLKELEETFQQYHEQISVKKVFLEVFTKQLNEVVEHTYKEIEKHIGKMKKKLFWDTELLIRSIQKYAVLYLHEPRSAYKENVRIELVGYIDYLWRTQNANRFPKCITFNRRFIQPNQAPQYMGLKPRLA